MQVFRKVWINKGASTGINKTKFFVEISTLLEIASTDFDYILPTPQMPISVRIALISFATCLDQNVLSSSLSLVLKLLA
jgi:hypothetical protein